MARTRADIYNQIVSTYVSDCLSVGIVVPDPNTWRLISRRRIWANAQAFAIWILEMMFDQLKIDVDDKISKMVPHTPQWYVEHAKKFQYGFNLVPEKDYYDNTGVPDDVVAASKIIAFAATVEEPFLRLKVATLNGANLQKLTNDQRDAFVIYIMKTKDCGVKLNDNTITSGDPDHLKMKVRVVINPLVLNAAGQIIGSTTKPVPDAIRGYLQNIGFNGKFSVLKMYQAIKAVNGVDDLHIDEISTQYGVLPFTSVDIDFVPDSGYLVIDDVDLDITYLIN